MRPPQQKLPYKPNLSRSEQKAAEVDSWVKRQLAQCREAEKFKTSRLKALREARDAEFTVARPSPGQATVTPPRRALIRRIWVSSSNAPSDS